jgi:molecular chaperone GrpE
VSVESSEIPVENPVETPVEETAAPDQATAEIAQLRGERDDLKELLLRRQAEFDNFRKRTERERSEYVQYAAMDTVKELLPVLDDFERAIKVECNSPEYVKGIEMIYNRMSESLKKQGLEPVDAVGKPFDPHLHQAIERVETTDAADNTVIGEFQRGYNFKGKLLRPAMVRVAVRG